MTAAPAHARGAHRVLCFSAHSNNLRAAALVRCLSGLGYDVMRPRARGRAGGIGEMARSLIPHCWFALTRRADLAVGFKPHLNVTLPLLICRLRGMPTWIDVDDIDHGYREGWLARVIELSQRPFPRIFHIVTYHNPRLKDVLRTQMGCRDGRLLRIEQGVHYDFFNDPTLAARTDDLRRTLGIADRRVGIYTAHLNVACDLELVLTAWRAVASRLPDAVLLVVGGGPRLDPYRRLAREMGLEGAVRFTGQVRHEQVPAYFALAQSALLYFSARPVNVYRCSLKLREYFASGVPVVCNDVGELKDFAHLTYQSGSDLREFAALAVRVLRGHSDGRERAARAHACEHLDWSRIVTVAEAEIAKRAGLKPGAPSRSTRPGAGKGELGPA